MEKVFSKAEDLFAHAKEYANNRMDAIKLNAAEKTSKVASNIIAVIVVLSVMMFFVLFAGIALAFALGDWMGKPYWGFLIVAGIYFLLGVAAWVLRKKFIQLPIMNSLLGQMYEEENEEDEED